MKWEIKTLYLRCGKPGIPLQAVGARGTFGEATWPARKPYYKVILTLPNRRCPMSALWYGMSVFWYGMSVFWYGMYARTLLFCSGLWYMSTLDCSTSTISGELWRRCRDSRDIRGHPRTWRRWWDGEAMPLLIPSLSETSRITIQLSFISFYALYDVLMYW